MDINGKGLSQLPSPVKLFIASFMVLTAVGLLLSLWLVLKSPILSGTGEQDSMGQMEAQGMGKEAIDAMKDGLFYENLKKSHIHHLGHVFMVFSVAGIYAFTREKSSIKIQIIIWTTIVTLIHTLAFLIYSRVLLIIFGSVYGVLMAYMMIIAVVDCFKPVRE